LRGPLLFGHIRFPTGGLLGALEYREQFKIKDKQQLKTSNGNCSIIRGIYAGVALVWRVAGRKGMRSD
jgi:hypothetical protein